MFTTKTGKVTFLRVCDTNSLWGPPGDQIGSQVIVRLNTAPDEAYGFELIPDDYDLPSRLAMLAMLRDAYINDITVSLDCDIDVGKKNGHLRRVNLDKSF